MRRIDTVHPIIRSQRPCRWRGRLIALVGVAGLWIAGIGFLAEPPPGGHNAVVLVFTIATLVGSAVLLLAALTFETVNRLTLSEELTTGPTNRVCAATGIREIAFGPDPAEDYAEQKLPIRMCEATVRPKSGRPIQLIISAGDAVRLREWAEQKGIAVSDPGGYSRPLAPRDVT